MATFLHASRITAEAHRHGMRLGSSALLTLDAHIQKLIGRAKEWAERDRMKTIRAEYVELALGKVKL